MLRTVWPSQKKKAVEDPADAKPSWEERYDAASGLPWYFNLKTGEHSLPALPSYGTLFSLSLSYTLLSSLLFSSLIPSILSLNLF